MNTFQGIVITDESKSYAVYTYRCDYISWPYSATIGYNAPPDHFENHPITDADLNGEIIACVHEGSPWNNVIYDLEPSPIVHSMTPEPSSSTGNALSHAEAPQYFFQEAIGACKTFQFRMVYVDVTDCAFCCLVQGAARMPDMTRVACYSFVMDPQPTASVIHSVV